MNNRYAVMNGRVAARRRRDMRRLVTHLEHRALHRVVGLADGRGRELSEEALLWA